MSSESSQGEEGDEAIGAMSTWTLTLAEPQRAQLVRVRTGNAQFPFAILQHASLAVYGPDRELLAEVLQTRATIFQGIGVILPKKKR